MCVDAYMCKGFYGRQSLPLRRGNLNWEVKQILTEQSDNISMLLSVVVLTSQTWDVILGSERWEERQWLSAQIVASVDLVSNAGSTSHEV